MTSRRNKVKAPCSACWSVRSAARPRTAARIGSRASCTGVRARAMSIPIRGCEPKAPSSARRAPRSTLWRLSSLLPKRIEIGGDVARLFRSDAGPRHRGLLIDGFGVDDEADEIVGCVGDRPGHVEAPCGPRKLGTDLTGRVFDAG